MIHVSLNVLIFIYLGLMLGLIGGAWFLSTVRRKRREHGAFHKVLRCTICSYEFADATENELPTCPRCGRINERHRFSRL